VDDEPDVRTVAEDLLSRLGYSTESVADGAEAVASYERARRAGKPFDAVILDLTIPGGMGGKVAVRRIRDMDPDACAIVSSGYSEDPALADPKAFGFSAMVAKPYRVEDLAAALQSALSGRRPKGPPA
jgi:two-component system cell cycle sensor histidine kinase/response regulator CckA